VNRLVRLHATSAAIAGVIASILLSTSVYAAAPSWLQPLDLRVHHGVAIQDADFSGQYIAVAWEEFDGPSVGIRTSNSAGQTFIQRTLIADATEPAVEICGTDVYLVYALHTGPGKWVIELAVRSIFGGEFAVTRIASGQGLRTDPDVACANGRVFVGWLERVEGETMRLLVANASISDGVFGQATSLGLTNRYFPSGLALAASGNTAYAAFVRTDAKLRLRRWSIGPGPSHAVSQLDTQIVGPGSDKNETYFPVIDADGDTVALSWGKCSGTLARVSDDRGVTWGPIRDIAFFGCGGVVDGGTGPVSIFVRGSRIALTYDSVGIPNFQASNLVRTHTAFNNSSRDQLGEHQNHMVGYIVVNGQVKLADPFDTFERVRFRRET